MQKKLLEKELHVFQRFVIVHNFRRS